MTASTRPRRSGRDSVAGFSALVLVALAAALTLAVPALALASDTTTRTAADIQARYTQLQPSFSGSPYAVAPGLSAPYSAGSLQAGELTDGLNAINYARYLAGVPDDVSLDTTYTDRAQHGAVLLAVGQFAHSQPQPSDMAADFYATANSATSSSNIGWGYGSLWSFNMGCMDDSDSSNIDRIGHRRWLLNPPLLLTGMGMASSRTDTYVFNWNRPAGFTYDSVKWPAAGYFPAEMFDASTAWSVTLNPSLYTWTSGTAGHTVTLTRQRDGKTWTFTSADTDKSGEYFNFETSGYGVANCFIFRPSPSSVGSYVNGDVFDVTLSGGITNKATGQPTSISYTTRFMSQVEGVATPVLPVAVGTHTAINGPKSAKVRHTLKLSGSVSPSAATGRVTIYKQRKVSGKWRSAGSAKASVSSGKYRYSFRPTRRGSWRFCAVYGGASGATVYASSRSGYRYVRVR
jgi:hypothetical protein